MADLFERYASRLMPLPFSGCWIWTGALKSRDGYGRIVISGRDLYAHRFFYEAARGPIGNGLELDHLCRVRSCVNPDHLESVPHRVNAQRGEAGAHWRAKSHCPQGHAYTTENTYWQPHRTATRPRINRVCRQCRSEKDRARKERLRRAANHSS